MSTRILLSKGAMAAVAAGLLAMAGGGFAHADTTDTSGAGGIGSGNQIQLPINLPINIGGNAVGVLGSSQARAATKTVVRSGTRSGGTAVTSGRGGVLSGNQVIAPVNAPVTACGNAVGALGAAETRCASRTTVTASGGRAITSGSGGLLSGNQILAPITAPLSACGNALDGKALMALCRTEVDTTGPGRSHHRPHPESHASAQLTGREESEPRGHRRLPFTGAPTALIGGIGLAALAAGAALLLLTRRRRPTRKPAQ